MLTVGPIESYFVALKRKRTFHVALWSGVFASLGALLAAANNFRLMTAPMESLAVFSDVRYPLLLFAVVSVCLYALATAASSEWARVAAVTAYVLAFAGFWVVAGAPSVPGRDTSSNAALASVILGTGAVPNPDNPNLAYAMFPGAHLLAAALAAVLGADVYGAIELVLLVGIAALTLLTWSLFRFLLGDPLWSAVATIVSVQGNPYSGLFGEYYPGNAGVLLFVTAALALCRIGSGRGAPWRAVLILAGGAAAVTHFVSSGVLLAFVSIGALGESRRRLASWTSVALLIVFISAWQLYWAVRFFTGWVDFVVKAAGDPGSALAMVFSFVGGRFTANAGAAIPTWAVVSQYSAIGLTFLAGAFFAVVSTVRRDWNAVAERFVITGVVAISTVTVFGSVAHAGSEYYRAFMFGGFFTVPSLFRTAMLRPKPFRTVILGTLMAAYLMLAVPTWLSFNKNIATGRDYQSERSVGAFLARSYGDGAGVDVYSAFSFSPSVWYSLPYARRQAVVPDLVTEADIAWGALFEGVRRFAQLTRGAGREVLVYSEDRGKPLMRYLYGAAPEDSRFAEVYQLLADESRVFDAGDAQAYVP